MLRVSISRILFIGLYIAIFPSSSCFSLYPVVFYASPNSAGFLFKYRHTNSFVDHLYLFMNLLSTPPKEISPIPKAPQILSWRKLSISLAIQYFYVCESLPFIFSHNALCYFFLPWHFFCWLLQRFPNSFLFSSHRSKGDTIRYFSANTWQGSLEAPSGCHPQKHQLDPACH